MPKERNSGRAELRKDEHHSLQAVETLVIEGRTASRRDQEDIPRVVTISTRE